MYVWIWRHLPGPLVVRVLQALVLVAAATTALFLWVFPRVEAALPYTDVTVPGPTGSPSPGPVSTTPPAPTPGTSPTGTGVAPTTVPGPPTLPAD
jgi:hypothetical protein